MVWCIPLQEDLLRYPAGENPEIRARVAPGEVIAASDLQVGFFHERRPYELWVPAVDDKKGPCCFGGGQSIIDDHLSKAAVEVEPEYILSVLRRDRPILVVVKGVDQCWQ